jgi:hypothetical protein
MSDMSTDQKIIKNKLGMLKLAEMLGSVSQACKMMGYVTQTKRMQFEPRVGMGLEVYADCMGGATWLRS